MSAVWFDADGVLLDYIGYFLTEYRYRLKSEFRNITPGQIVEYDMSDLFPGGTEEFVDIIWESHNRNEAGLMRGTCTPAKLHALKNQGHDIRVITQFDAMPRYQRARIENLAREFGPVFDEVVFTKRGECKLDYLAGRHADYLIEDNPHLIADYKELVSRGQYAPPFQLLAIEHSYNRDVLKDSDIPSFTYADYAIDKIMEESL